MVAAKRARTAETPKQPSSGPAAARAANLSRHLHAACEVAGAGNGATEVSKRARRGKPRIRPRDVLRATAPAPDPTRAKSGSKRKGGSATASRAVTGKAVANLRKKLGMSKTQFARLLGLSVGTVGNWERTKGRLNLQARTLSAWNGVKRLTQKAAWKRLERR